MTMYNIKNLQLKNDHDPVKISIIVKKNLSKYSDNVLLFIFYN